MKKKIEYKDSDEPNAIYESEKDELEVVELSENCIWFKHKTLDKFRMTPRWIIKLPNLGSGEESLPEVKVGQKAKRIIVEF